MIAAMPIEVQRYEASQRNQKWHGEQEDKCGMNGPPLL
jgi:hypothetical protein